MTNPNNAVGTNAAYNGRTSVNAFNDDLAAYSRGVVSGWACSPKTGLKVQVGGNGTTRDVAIAEDNVGNRTTINNISAAPIEVTISAAPSSNSRIDAIVAYVDNPATGASTAADNPSACGLIVVKGTAASSPTKPNDSKIRTGITSDGASGSTAYYVVLAYVTIASGTTDLTSSNISSGDYAGVKYNNINFASFSRGTITTVSSNTYTAPTLGFFAFRAIINTNSYGSSARVAVNDNTVWRFQWNSYTANYNCQLDDQVLVFPGEVIKTELSANASWGYREFIPII